MKSMFISGISSGIGKGLALFYAQKGYEIYGVSRRALDYSHPNIHHACCDLTDYEKLERILNSLLPINEIETVFLNAGVLGKMTSMQNANLDELKNIMETNLWSQKVLVDYFLQNKTVHKMIGISTGAAINGNIGWSGYSISKAAFNMLIQLYSKEYPKTYFLALAPGLVDTPMQDYLCGEVSALEFPSVQKLHDARGTSSMPTPEKFAEKFDKLKPEIYKNPSGSFFDIRMIS